MINQKSLDKINKIIKDLTFTYTGNFLYPLDVGDKKIMSFKIELLGYREMIHVGEKKQYLKVKLIITEIYDEVAKLIFKNFKEKISNPEILKYIKDSLYYFYTRVTSYIEDTIKFFDNDDIFITIDELEINSL